jgi:hypothetical protein
MSDEYEDLVASGQKCTVDGCWDLRVHGDRCEDHDLDPQRRFLHEWQMRQFQLAVNEIAEHRSRA